MCVCFFLAIDLQASRKMEMTGVQRTSCVNGFSTKVVPQWWDLEDVKTINLASKVCSAFLCQYLFCIVSILFNNCQCLQTTSWSTSQIIRMSTNEHCASGRGFRAWSLATDRPMCRHFLMGKCFFGDLCTFSHGGGRGDPRGIRSWRSIMASASRWLEGSVFVSIIEHHYSPNWHYIPPTILFYIYQVFSVLFRAFTDSWGL